MALTVTHAAAVPEDAALVALGVRIDHLEEDAGGADLALLGPRASRARSDRRRWWEASRCSSSWGWAPRTTSARRCCDGPVRRS